MPKIRKSKETEESQIIDLEKVRKERGKKPTRRQVAKSLRRRLVYSLIVLTIGIIISVSIYNVFTLKAEKTAAEAQLSALEKEKLELEEELMKVDSKEYVEQQAREGLKMILPGEILYILKEDEGAENETSD